MIKPAKHGPLRAVIFDMDGVLIDSEPVYMENQYRQLAPKYPWITRESMFPLAGMSGQEYPFFMAQLCRRSPADPAFAAELKGMEKAQVDYRAILRPEAPGVLAALRQQGLLLALASSSSMRTIRRVLEACDIGDYFASVVSGEQFAHSKPDPEIYRVTMERLGCRPAECMVVEDSTYGVTAGAAAGALVAALRDDRFPFDQSAAQLRVDSLAELPALAACGGRRIRAAFFDIDGTLAEEGTHRIPASTCQALAALRRRGVAVMVSTGRHPLEIQEERLLPGLAFDGGVYVNGHLCEAAGRPVLEESIPAEDLRGLQEFLEEKQRSCIFLERDCMYANRVDDRMRAEQARIGTAVPPIRPIGDLPQRRVYQVIPFVAREEEAQLRARMPGCRFFRWGESAVDVASARGGKAAGMRAVCAALGISPAQAIAFGDADNDIDILRHAGIGVAMGTAPSSVQSAADFVTAPAAQDGVWKALKRFCLI